MTSNITIISTNLNKNILKNYPDYNIITTEFTNNDLLKYSKVIFYEVLNNKKEEEIKALFNYLKEHHIAFINVTNNEEQVLLTDYLIIYDKEKILIEGSTLEVLKQEKLLKRLGIALPFMVELSLLLQDYGLIKDIYLDYKSLEDALWN